MPDNDTADLGDPFDLERFTSAQESTYGRALAELRSGRKRTHWMWYIFPQIEGLGQSTTSRHYAIKTMEEARRYLAHPVLGARLLECARAIDAMAGLSAAELLGHPDDLKLKSSMTLFACAAGPGSVFARVLGRYFNGERDARTLQLLAKLEGREKKETD
jgi:uncharacterized protein (DUF1810 family)